MLVEPVDLEWCWPASEKRSGEAGRSFAVVGGGQEITKVRTGLGANAESQMEVSGESLLARKKKRERKE